jgi:NAD(P)H dehydrogenase (quinone)
MKQFLDTTGGLWLKGELEDSTASIQRGQEKTILTALVPLIHLGMVFVGTPYGQNRLLLVTDGIGGSPYGPGTLAGTDGLRQPIEAELTTARNLGTRLARVAGPSQGPQGESCVRGIEPPNLLARANEVID